MAETIQIEVDERQQLDFHSQQLADFRAKVQRYGTSLETAEESAQEYLLQMRQKYDINGKPFFFDQEQGVLVLTDHNQPTLEAEAEVIKV